jgi:hypothetical protein
MVFGKKCIDCGNDANQHTQECGIGRVIEKDYWLCNACNNKRFDEKMRLVGR